MGQTTWKYERNGDNDFNDDDSNDDDDNSNDDDNDNHDDDDDFLKKTFIFLSQG